MAAPCHAARAAGHRGGWARPALGPLNQPPHLSGRAVGSLPSCSSAWATSRSDQQRLLAPTATPARQAQRRQRGSHTRRHQAASQLFCSRVRYRDGTGEWTAAVQVREGDSRETSFSGGGGKRDERARTDDSGTANRDGRRRHRHVGRWTWGQLCKNQRTGSTRQEGELCKGGTGRGRGCTGALRMQPAGRQRHRTHKHQPASNWSLERGERGA